MRLRRSIARHRRLRRPPTTVALGGPPLRSLPRRRLPPLPPRPRLKLRLFLLSRLRRSLPRRPRRALVPRWYGATVVLLGAASMLIAFNGLSWLPCAGHTRRSPWIPVVGPPWATSGGLSVADGPASRSRSSCAPSTLKMAVALNCAPGGVSPRSAQPPDTVSALGAVFTSRRPRWATPRAVPTSGYTPRSRKLPTAPTLNRAFSRSRNGRISSTLGTSGLTRRTLQHGLLAFISSLSLFGESLAVRNPRAFSPARSAPRRPDSSSTRART